MILSDLKISSVPDILLYIFLEPLIPLSDSLTQVIFLSHLIIIHFQPPVNL